MMQPSGQRPFRLPDNPSRYGPRIMPVEIHYLPGHYLLESMSCPSVRPKPRARGTDFPGRMLLLSRTRPPRPVFLVEEIAAEALPSVSCRILRCLGPGLW